jgi:hypothetical protein
MTSCCGGRSWLVSRPRATDARESVRRAMARTPGSASAAAGGRCRSSVSAAHRHRPDHRLPAQSHPGHDRPYPHRHREDPDHVQPSQGHHRRRPRLRHRRRDAHRPALRPAGEQRPGGRHRHRAGGPGVGDGHGVLGPAAGTHSPPPTTASSRGRKAGAATRRGRPATHGSRAMDRQVERRCLPQGRWGVHHARGGTYDLRNDGGAGTASTPMR